jgi:uncharacterized protein (TIGR03067 family)
MRSIAIMAVLCTGFGCRRQEQVTPAMKDIDRIQGTWKLVSGERNGEALPAEITTNVSLIFSGNKLTTKNKNTVTEALFTLHPETNPRGIDLDMEGNVGLGIYELGGEKLTILHGEVEEARPANFDALKNRNLTLLILNKISE